MVKIKNKKSQVSAQAGQAAIELAVFGAILIFILGTIVRTAIGNGYAQNDNMKAMRMAMLASWTDSKVSNVLGRGIIAHSNASFIYVEDRLSPDFNKYGDLDRNPFVAQGSGTFSPYLLYPLDPEEVQQNVPIMDVYINGQHFPFTTASYLSKRIIRPACPAGTPQALGGGLSPGQCAENQCLRSAREWAGGTVTAGDFSSVMTGIPLDANTETTSNAYGVAIFNALVAQGFVGGATGVGPITTGYVVTSAYSSIPSNFTIADPMNSNQPLTLTPTEISNIQNVLQKDSFAYKLFYTMAANGSSDFSAGASDTLPDPPFDLQRNNDPTNFVPAGMRPYIAWQWKIVPATSTDSIKLDASNNQYPTYDIDGRLKEVTVYGFQYNSDGTPTVTYEDPAGGDIDSSWDLNSCGPKPGLQNDSQIYTFTKNGTYLQIKEGKLYNIETDQYVRSANQRDTIDLIQRSVQLSNNTGRFCDSSGRPTAIVEPCADESTCEATGQYNDGKCSSGNGTCVFNAVEICVAESSPTDNCFTSANIAQTCYDTSDNMLFIRSRLEDRRGRFWMTDTSGQMSIK